MSTRFEPEHSAEDFWACHRLLAALLPAHRLRALLTIAETPSAAIALPFETLISHPQIALTTKQAERLGEAARDPIPPALTTQAANLGVWVISIFDPAYPRHLTPFTDAPPLLFVRGDLVEEDSEAVAIVGSRRATKYGIDQTTRFAQAFARSGLTIVSGGALGIDTAAHRGALAAGGRTLAILGCGVDVVYPADNRGLYAEIVRQGALLSEFALGTRPEPWRFPTRNRIIAGIARATLLLETPRDSGAMITARDAAQYGRDVWAVPGSIGAGDRSRGCHLLIQDGAGLADSPEDILRALGIAVAGDAEPDLPRPTRGQRSTSAISAQVPQATSRPIVVVVQGVLDTNEAPTSDDAAITAGLSEFETRLLATFGSDPRHVDDASVEAALTAAEAAVGLTLLEMKGLLRRLPGNLYVRAR